MNFAQWFASLFAPPARTGGIASIAPTSKVSAAGQATAVVHGTSKAGFKPVTNAGSLGIPQRFGGKTGNAR